MKTAAAVAYLKRQQQTDGSFGGIASDTLDSFKSSRKQPTAFPTLLILDCLQLVPGTASLRAVAAAYIQSNMSQQGSWNYWEKSSRAKQKEPYPDDLDDTACAVAALSRYDASLVAGERLGQFARLLIATEQATGGPYNTWLIDWQTLPKWHHVDLAVNANIAYALSLQQVTVSGLMAYVDEQIRTDNYHSDYYVGVLPVLYFLARWYRGVELAQLQRAVANQLAHIDKLSSLHQALTLSAACWLDLPMASLKVLAKKLQAGMQDDHWPAAAFYVDPVYDGRQHYGGSAPLTTAFALEALCLYDQKLRPQIKLPIVRTKSESVSVLNLLKKQSGTIVDVALRRRYCNFAQQIAGGAHGAQIATPASLLASANNWDIPKLTLNNLNLGSLNGWLAYTIYDDFIDGEAQPELLSVANIGLRRSFDHFRRALPEQSDFCDLVTMTFDGIDSANAWELQHARALIRKGKIRVTNLPDYGNYSMLARRSWGHSLAATGVVVAQYGTLDHPCVLGLQQFFHYFLIARQLNDDAHDWEEDLLAGRLSPVVSLLLAALFESPTTITIKAQLDDLRQHFWQHTMTEVGELIRANLALAEQALEGCQTYLDRTVFKSWLQDIEQAVDMALRGRADALKFMQAYEAVNE